MTLSLAQPISLKSKPLSLSMWHPSFQNLINEPCFACHSIQIGLKRAEKANTSSKGFVNSRPDHLCGTWNSTNAASTKEATNATMFPQHSCQNTSVILHLCTMCSSRKYSYSPLGRFLFLHPPPPPPRNFQ